MQTQLSEENTPLIVAAIGSPTYRLAKELARILSPLADSFVKNLAEFAQVKPVFMCAAI